MSDLNVVLLGGRLIKNSCLENVGDTDKKKAVICLAVNNYVKNGNEGMTYPNYFYIEVTHDAENISKYLIKGKFVNIEGYLHQDRWADKETGKKMSKIKIIPRNIFFVESSKEKIPVDYSKELSAEEIGKDENKD